MALTRSFLKGMGLTDEQVGAIIEAHTETTDALKEQRDEFKDKAKKYDGVQKELDELKAQGTGEDEWKAKYESEHKAFDEYKKSQEAEKQRESKVAAYKALLKESNVSDKLVDLVVKANAGDIEALELDEKGNIKTAEDLKKKIATDYADYITDERAEGVNVDNPPNNDGDGSDKDLGKLSMEEYIAARMKK